MELSATAISSASKVEMGTVHRHKSTVFFRHDTKRLYLTTLTKLPKPRLNVAPPAALRPE